MTDIKSLAARILGDESASQDAKRLAGYVLGDADNERTTEQPSPQESVKQSPPLQGMTAMTKKTKEDKAREAEANRQQPDKPLGLTRDRETDPFEGERDEDGFTPAQVNQRQMSQPGSEDQTGADGEKVGEDTDIANPRP